MTFAEKFRRIEAGERSPQLARFEALLNDPSPAELEARVAESVAVTRRNFGKTMRLFAPLYLSNECVNNCQYCGFSRDNPIFRVTLEVDQVVREAQHLAAQGFRSVLLVAGEHPRFVSDGYLEKCIVALREFVPSIGIEVGPMEAPEYARMVDTGSEALVVYQETYDREAYRELHTSGPKKNFDWRLDCPERGFEGGFRRIGIGALFGLADWRLDALGLAAHVEHLQKLAWKSQLSVSFPRMRPAAGGFVPLPEHELNDSRLVQLIAAFRVSFPTVGIVLSTRESAALRDSLAPLGITTMSAGSHTEPGGYTGEGRDDLHLTVKGRRVELSDDEPKSSCATGQFDIADQRSPSEVAARLLELGLEPVWKDWDAAILQNPTDTRRSEAFPEIATV